MRTYPPSQEQCRWHNPQSPSSQLAETRKVSIRQGRKEECAFLPSSFPLIFLAAQAMNVYIPPIKPKVCTRLSANIFRDRARELLTFEDEFAFWMLVRNRLPSTLSRMIPLPATTKGSRSDKQPTSTGLVPWS